MEAESTTHGKIRKYDRHSKNGRGVLLGIRKTVFEK